MQSGEPVEFEFSSADATTAAEISIRNPGDSAGRILKSNERFIITSISSVIATGAVLAAIFNDENDNGALNSGECMYRTGPGNNSVEYCNGMAAALGVTPKAIASAAGQVDFMGTGVIINS